MNAIVRRVLLVCVVGLVALAVVAGFKGSGARPQIESFRGEANGHSSEPAKPPQTQSVGGRIYFRDADGARLPVAGEQPRRIISMLSTGPNAMAYGNYRWNEAGAPPGPLWVRIDLSQQLMSVFRGGHEIGTSVILFGSDGKPTPTGRFPIMDRKKDHVSNLYDADMPFSLRLTADGVAIHASDVRQRRATHGCIGIPFEFASKLFSAARVGDLVFILPADPVHERKAALR